MQEVNEIEDEQEMSDTLFVAKQTEADTLTLEKYTSLITSDITNERTFKILISEKCDNKDAYKALTLLDSYLKLFRVATANNINIEKKLQEHHQTIYLFLISAFEYFLKSSRIDDNNEETQKSITQMQNMLNDVIPSDVMAFNTFAFLQICERIKSEHDVFIRKEEEELQKKREAIVAEFNEKYVESKISTYAKKFSELYKTENLTKKIWLAVLVACCLAFFALFYHNIVVIQQTIESDFKKIISFIPLTLLAFIAITWTGRRYAICREQEITYNHLTTILSTYKAFQENLDETNKGILILEIARIVSAIPKPLTKESPTFDYAKIIDIVKILNKDSK